MDPYENPIESPESGQSPLLIPPGGPSSDGLAGAEPSLLYALIGGSFVALGMAILWALITVATEHQYGIVAIIVGLVTGAAVRYFGRGEATKFGVAGALLSLAGCVAGNILSVYGFFAKANSLSIFQALFQVDLARVLSTFPQTFSTTDLAFYAIAVYEGYRFSFGSRGRAALIFSSLMKPASARFRKPLLVFGGMLVLGGIYALRHLASGPVTLTYKSGAKQALGELRAGKPHGLWTYYYENGGIQSKISFREGEADGEASWWSAEGKLTREGTLWQGMEHGEWKLYDANGNVARRGRFEYGRPAGEWEYFYPNKEKSMTCRYALGAMDGECVTWHPNGVMSEQGKYQDGKKIGTWRTWDIRGMPRCEFRYEGDTELLVNCWAADHVQTVKEGNGEFVSYHPGGQVQEKGEVKGGRRAGVWYIYHPNGKMSMKQRWLGDIRLVTEKWNDKGEALVQNGNGTCIAVDNNGKPIAKGNYKDGLQDGEWTIYDPDSGKVIEVLEYAAGIMEGQATGYLESGAKAWQGTFKKDRREGEWTWYHEDGAISSKFKMIGGKKEGDQIFYNSQGKKVRVETYKNGALVAERNLI